MRTLILLFISLNCFATNYYVKPTGSDVATGTSDAQAWQSLSKVNNMMASLVNGDVIYLKAGGIYKGSLVATKQITLTKYGVGTNPVISGFSDIISWVDMGNNLWESATAVSTLNTCNMVTVNNVQVSMGRFPNSSYTTYNTTGVNTRLKAANLSETNWTGADVVIRLNRFIATRKTILSQNIDTITYSPLLVYVPSNNYGLFIENDVRTLDVTNEWYYNPTTKKITYYSVGSPTNVKASIIDTLITVSSAFITIDSVDFEGSNMATIARNATSNSYRDLIVKNSTISFSGSNAIDMRQRDNLNLAFENLVINNTNNNGIQAGAGCLNSSVRNVSTYNTGILIGMIAKDVNFSPFAINVGAKNVVIENCSVKNSGYIGIASMGDSVIIQNNLVDTVSYVLDDGSGIYYNNGSGNTTTSGIKIRNNIVKNSIGAPLGGGTVIVSYGEGIYLDDNSNGVEVSGNTVTNSAKDAILLHNARNCTVVDNITYDNRYGFALSDDNLGDAITGLVVKRNQFIAKTTAQYSATFYSIFNNVAGIGLLDSNLYTRPILDSATIKMEYPNMGWGFRTLAVWKTYSGKDVNSFKLFKTINNISELDFQTNITATPVVYNFTGLSKIGTNQTVYNNSATVPAYRSLVLLDNGLAAATPCVITGVTVAAGVIACNVGTTTITATAAPSGSYQYNLNGGAFQGSNIFTVNAGSYTIVAREASNTTCTATVGITVTNPTAVVATAFVSTPIAVFGGTGAITASATGGTGTKTYLISGTPLNTTGATTGIFTGLLATTYIVSAMDANGCTGMVSIVLAIGATPTPTPTLPKIRILFKKIN